jgi:pimeloyl-ACP methyl ester carboxylesterase
VVELAFREYGTGAPLLALHGLLGSSANWVSVARRLADRHRVLLPDLRNHGRSPHAPGMDYGELARDVLGLLDRLGLDRAALLGHSMGGKVAMTLALGARERVTRLVVVDIAPVAYRHEQQRAIVQALGALDLARLRTRARVDAELARSVPDRRVRDLLLQNLVADSAGYAWRIDLAEIGRRLDQLAGFAPPPHAHPFPGPTLFLAGERSGYVRPDHHDTIRRLFPDSRFAVLPGAGHWVHADQPAAFLAAAGEFLGAPAAQEAVPAASAILARDPSAGGPPHRFRNIRGG